LPIPAQNSAKATTPNISAVTTERRRIPVWTELFPAGSLAERISISFLPDSDRLGEFRFWPWNPRAISREFAHETMAGAIGHGPEVGKKLLPIG